MVEAESPGASWPTRARQRFLEVAGRDALQVQDRDQHIEALRPTRVRRQDGRVEPDVLVLGGLAVTHTRLAHRHWADAGHDLALGQMPVAHNPAAAVFRELVGVLAEEIGNLGLDGLHEPSRALHCARLR